MRLTCKPVELEQSRLPPHTGWASPNQWKVLREKRLNSPRNRELCRWVAFVLELWSRLFPPPAAYWVDSGLASLHDHAPIS